MKIYPITANKQIRFNANNKHTTQPTEPTPESKNKPLPGWARKTMIGTLIFFAVKNSPGVQSYLNPYEPTQEDLDRSEYYHDILEMRKPKEKSPAFYQLNRLNDFEVPKIKKLAKNTYSLNFELDDKKIDMQIKLDSENKDTIRGKVKINNAKAQNFKAVFSPDDINEFKILLNENENEKIVLGRNYSGDLYQIKNKKEKYLNKKNVETYEKHQEYLENQAFWDKINPTLRKLNILLLMFLVYTEMKQDQYEAKKKELEEELKNKLNDKN